MTCPPPSPSLTRALAPCVCRCCVVLSFWTALWSPKSPLRVEVEGDPALRFPHLVMDKAPSPLMVIRGLSASRSTGGMTHSPTAAAASYGPLHDSSLSSPIPCLSALHPPPSHVSLHRSPPRVSRGLTRDLVASSSPTYLRAPLDVVSHSPCIDAGLCTPPSVHAQSEHPHRPGPHPPAPWCTPTPPQHPRGQSLGR
jgi:hypothetical protein